MVHDILGWLASGMEIKDIVHDYPELTKEDVLACLAYAADGRPYAFRPYRTTIEYNITEGQRCR